MTREERARRKEEEGALREEAGGVAETILEELRTETWSDLQRYKRPAVFDREGPSGRMFQAEVLAFDDGKAPRGGQADLRVTLTMNPADAWRMVRVLVNTDFVIRPDGSFWE